MSTEPLLLAVDDEAGILRLIKLELTAQGFRVMTASNGEEALRLVEERRPDVVLLDVVMPEITGLEVMRRIRQVPSGLDGPSGLAAALAGAALEAAAALRRARLSR